MKTKAIIQEVLDDLSDGQWNLQAHGARDLIAGLITDQIAIYIDDIIADILTVESIERRGEETIVTYH
jgi:hypothetical protein